MADDKAKLLRSLAIDRSETVAAPRARRRWPLVALAAILVAAGALGGVVYFSPALRLTGATEQAAAPQSAPPSAQPPIAAAPAEPRRAGSLVASGYVVARRKATVAAEITGKVVEVMIEEGMVVKAGQIVARLDSVLAEKDVSLARSRAEAAQAAGAMISAELEDAHAHPGAGQVALAEELRERGRPHPRRCAGRRAHGAAPAVAGASRNRPARRRTQRGRARQAPDARAVQRRRGRPQRPARRDDLAAIGRRRLHPHRHLHDRRHGFDRDRGRRQRGLHRPGDGRQRHRRRARRLS